MFFILFSLISSLVNLKSSTQKDVYKFVLEDSIYHYKNYVYINTSGHFVFNKPGSPSIPYYSYIIPAKGVLGKIKIEHTRTEYYSGKLLPLPSYDKKGMVAGYFENLNYKENFIPPGILRIDTLNIRGYRFYRVNVFPVRYSENRIILLREIIFSIKWQNKKYSPFKSFLFGNIIGYPYYRIKMNRGSKLISFFDSALIWFKIPVLKSGVYRVTYSDLKNKGLLATFSVNEIVLYSRGADTFKGALNERDFYAHEIPMMVKDQNSNGIFDEGDFIIFYAEGPFTWKKQDTTFLPFHNPYCDTTFYWLGFGKRGKRFKILEFHNGDTINTATGFYHHERDITNIAWKGLLWEGEAIIRFQGNSSGETSFNFVLNDVVGPEGILRIRLVGGEGIRRKVIISSSAVLDTFSPGGYFIIERTISPFPLQNGTNHFTVKIQRIEGEDDSYGDQIYLDYYDVIYQTTTQSTQNKEFFIRGNGNFVFPVGDKDATVFNITNPLSPYLLSTRSSGNIYFAHDTATGLSRYFVAREFYTPEIILEPQAGRLYRENFSNTDMLIITGKSLEPALWRYKTYREANFPILKDSLWMRGSGNIKVVTCEDIYRDFGYGLHDPVAIRNFVYHVYNASIQNGEPRLKFLLVVGDGTYDYRGIESREGNIVPPYEPFETADINVYAEANETFYTDMNGDNFPDIFYGRVTARTENEVAAYFNKIIAYEKQTAASPYRQRILLVSDDERGPYGGDSEASWHIPQAEALFTGYTPQNAEKVIVYETDFGSAQNPEERGRLAKAALINEMNRGALIMGFYGHSNPVQMTHEMLFTINDVNLINTHGKPPLCVILTCKFGAFARLEPPRIIAEDWILNPHGVLGVIASPNATFAFTNGVTGRRIFGFALNGKVHPLGEVSLSGRDPSYFLLGDPSVFFYYPLYDSTISFGNQDDTLYTGELSSIPVSGTDKGTYLVSIVGVPGVKTYYTYPNHYVLRYHESTPMLYRGSLRKEKDTTTFKFFLPLSADTGTIYINSLKSYDGILKEATGHYELRRGNVTGDLKGPDILLNVGDKVVTPGEIVNTPLTFSLKATLKDPHGINLVGTGDEKGIYLVLDNTTYDLTSYFRYSENSSTEGSLTYKLTLENEGEYEASFVAYDNAQNRNQITFKIYAEESAQRISKVLLYPNPLRGEGGVYITFEIEKPARVQVSIYSIAGTLIYKTHENTYPAGFNSIFWDGRDMFGNLPASGLYIVVLTVKTNEKKLRIKKGLFIERR